MSHEAELEVIKGEIVKLEAEDAVIEGEIIQTEEDLTELFKEKQRLQEMLDAVAQKIREKNASRFRTNTARAKIKRDLEDQKQKAEEIARFVKLQEQQEQSWEMMRQRAEEKQFKWLPYLKKHQWEASLKIAQYGSCLLGDAMGLGKSLESIAAADLMGAKRVAVFAPAAVVMSMLDEFRMWSPNRNIVPLKSATKQVKEFMTPLIQNAEEITLLMNFESLWGRGDYNKKFIQALEDAEFDLVIVDEAHNAKNEDGRTFEFLAKLRRTAKHYLPMSGTFLLNSPEDLWPNLYLIDPERFYNKNSFLRQYCQQDYETGKWIFKSGGAKSLVAQLGGRIIQRKLEDTDIVLPPQTINEVLIKWDEVPQDQKEVMVQLSAHAQLVIEESGESISIAEQIALITRQRQAAVWPAAIQIKECDKDEFGEDIPGTEHIVFDASKMCSSSIKQDYAVKLLLKNIKEGRRCVVFSQFKSALVELEKRLQAEGISVCRFDGDTTDPQRQIIKKDFLRAADGTPNPEYKYDVVLANFRTGGVGLTFTEATYMLLLDEEWNPGKNEQAYARICRIGQTEETFVDILRMEQHPGTIDMWMRDLNEFKKAMIDGLETAITQQPQYDIGGVFANGYAEIKG